MAEPTKCPAPREHYDLARVYAVIERVEKLGGDEYEAARVEGWREISELAGFKWPRERLAPRAQSVELPSDVQVRGLALMLRGSSSGLRVGVDRGWDDLAEGQRHRWIVFARRAWQFVASIRAEGRR